MNKLVDPWYCSFFDDAVAIKAIIYRPSTNKIINVGLIAINSDNADQKSVK